MNAADYVKTVNLITLKAQDKIRALASFILSKKYTKGKEHHRIKATMDLIKKVKQIAILTDESIKDVTIRTDTGMRPMDYSDTGIDPKALRSRIIGLFRLLRHLADINTDKLLDGVKLPGYKKLDGTTVAEERVTAISFEKGWANNVENAKIILEYFQHLDLQLIPQISGLQLENALTKEAAQRAKRIARRKAQEAEREQAERSNKSVGESKKRKASLYLKF